MRAKALKKRAEKSASAERQPTLIRTDPRLEDNWKKISFREIRSNPATQGEVAILSYPDDEGIRLNRGRGGANEGPARILNYLGRLVYQGSSTPDLFILTETFPNKSNLAARHDLAENWVRELLRLGYRVISLGGGHDYGYPDAAAYFDVHRGTILNVDAHLDVRPVVNGVLNSGTPFFRFAEKYGGRNLVEWGIQEQANALMHLQYAHQNKIKIASYRDPMPKIRGPVGLSICLDAFQGIRGVSAPAMVGLDPDQGLAAIEYYGRSSHWLGLYECSPAHDPETEDSARLAALFAYRFIHSSASGRMRL